MTLEKFMEMYDNWNGNTTINNNNLDPIVAGHTLKIMECELPLAGVESYDELLAMEVVSFGFYDNELTVRVKKPNIKWCGGMDQDDWEDQNPEKGSYLHGKCDEWVLENYQPGDIPVIWNNFDEDVGKVCLVHCFIQRGDKYVDVRGETCDINDVEYGFDYWPDNDKYYCADLDDYKRMIRKICRYRSKKWK